MKNIVAFLLFVLFTGACSKEMTPATGYLDLETVKLYYEDIGEGLPVIMIHGGFINHRMWDEQFEVVARDFRAVRYDVRGHGLSVSDSVVFNDRADLAKLMDHLSIEKAVLMGFSMGGYVATDFALEYPDRVLGLVLAAPGLNGYAFDSPECGKYIAELMEVISDFDKRTDCFARYWLVGPRREPSEVDAALRTRVKDMLLSSTNRWEIAPLENRLFPVAAGRLAEIEVPTLVLVGSIDMPDIHEIVDKMEKEIPGARRVTIDGAAHMLNMEKPEEFNRAVLEFIGSIRSE
jgi:pimeloyl-ACP methyl ester carboxylesterase